MIKLKKLLEQAKAKQKIYKNQPIKGTFLANYVTPSTAWRKELDPIIKAIQELVAKNYRLDQIKVVIRSGASAAKASNRYKGKNPPNHNFVKYGEDKGGLLPPNGWVKSGTADFKTIDAGNKFLAAERGRQLKAKIEPVLKQLFPQMPANFVMTDPRENSEQFASYQVQYAATPQVIPTTKEMAAYLQGSFDIDLGSKQPGLNTRKFSGKKWPSLEAEYAIWRNDPSKIPAGLVQPTRESNTLKMFGTVLRPLDNITDLGLGPGKGVPLTRELYQFLGFKLNLKPFNTSQGLANYGGTWVDWAQEQYIIAKKLESTGEDPAGSADKVASKYSSLINADGSPKGFAGTEPLTLGPKPGPIQWNTVNPATKNQTRPQGSFDKKGKAIGTPTDPNTNDPRAIRQEV